MKAVALALLVAPLTAQLPDVWGDATGHVRDAAGKPIAGADVRIEARIGGLTVFREVAEALFRRHRPPPVRTDKDGNYRIPLLPEHREVSALGLDWWLVVTKEGYQAWYESLPRGLYGYLSSEVVLRARDPADEVTFVADPAQTAAGVAVSRWGGESFVIEFDANGNARAHLPRVPCPAQPGTANAAAYAWSVSGQPLRRPEHRLATAASSSPEVTVRRSDGKPPVHVRALLWNGIDSRWVALPDPPRVPGGVTLIAVVADGCRMDRATTLTPLPAVPTRTVRVRDRDGKPIAHARGLLLAAEEWRHELLRAAQATPSARARWRHPRAANAAGDIDIGDSLDHDTPSVLLVAAEGYEPANVFDPAGLGDEVVTLTPRPVASLELRVIDDDGAPLAGARLCLPDMAGAPATFLGEDLVTGADGVVRVGGLHAKDFAVFVMRRGHVSRMVPGRFAADQRTTLAVTLPASTASAWVLTDQAGKPQPFATIVVQAGPDGTVGHNARFWPIQQADTGGRLVLPDAAEPRFSVLNHGEIPVHPRPRGFGRIPIDAVLPVLVRPAAGLELASLHCVTGPGRRSGGLGGHAGREGAILFPTAGDHLVAHLSPSGTARLAPTQFATLPIDPATGMRQWLVDPQRLHVDLPPDAADPNRWFGVRANGSLCRIDRGEVVVFRTADGSWRLGDSTVDAVWFTHPLFVPMRVALTKEQRLGRQPIALRATPGSPLSVNVPHGATGVMHLEVKLTPNDTTMPTFTHSLGFMAARDGSGNRQQHGPELPALPPGNWSLEVSGVLVGPAIRSNSVSRWSREVKVDGTTPIEMVADRE